ncbi:flagellar hook assembly protein FlgD [Tepidicaulis sp. LMO-SS28]|uniref:flagellar hook assembly protein FlgD n=1 Tax=Tepidicaulis sp. LMO-SS28 TaxID=3447455 RepID=UPI003EE28F81
MLDILGSNPISVAAQVQGNGSNQAGSASNALNSNFDTFLTLLTTQLRHQDPMNPMKSNEFTQQLVQYSNVEQSIQTNKHLENLMAVSSASTASHALSYIGKEVDVVSSAAQLEDGEANWIYGLAETAEEAKLQILNQDGAVVYEEELDGTTGAKDFTWDGKNNNGEQQPDGWYVLDITATNAEGEQVQYSSRVTGTVSGVDFSEKVPLIHLGDITVAASDVLAIREKTAEQPPAEEE